MRPYRITALSHCFEKQPGCKCMKLYQLLTNVIKIFTDFQNDKLKIFLIDRSST